MWNRIRERRKDRNSTLASYSNRDAETLREIDLNWCLVMSVLTIDVCCVVGGENPSLMWVTRRNTQNSGSEYICCGDFFILQREFHIIFIHTHQEIRRLCERHTSFRFDTVSLFLSRFHFLQKESKAAPSPPQKKQQYIEYGSQSLHQ